jgi:Protein of unknown function (DUF2630)
MAQDREQPILDRIEALVEEEQRLRAASVEDRIGFDDDQRLAMIGAELDRCWALLRRRRADPNAPDEPPDVPWPPNEFDGPEPEPPHLEHGVHDDVPAPDPEPPRDIP